MGKQTVPYEVDVILEGDLEEAFRSVRSAIGDYEGMSLNHRAVPEDQRDLKWLLEGWGWDFDGRYISGLYGDWTDSEEDERLFTALAPYVRWGSHIVMGEVDAEYGPYFAWVFESGSVTRKPAERHVEYRIGN